MLNPICFLDTIQDMDTALRFTTNGFVADAAISPTEVATDGRLPPGFPDRGGDIAQRSPQPQTETPKPAVGEARQRLFRFVMANVSRDDREVLAAIAATAPATRALLADPARLSTHLQALADELGFLQPVQLNRLKSLALQSNRTPAMAPPAKSDQDETALIGPARPSAPSHAPAHNGMVGVRSADVPKEITDPARLLENVTYQVRRNGAVDYALDGQPIFTDHGEYLAMVRGADEQERAILAAILIAKEKFGGTFDLTGDADFKRRAIEIMLKHRVNVRLKDPEQDAMRRALAGESFPQPAQEGTASLEKVSKPPQKRANDAEQGEDKRHAAHDSTGATGQAAPAAPHPRTAGSEGRTAAAILVPRHQDGAVPTKGLAIPENSPPVDRLAGRVIATGVAPYADKAGNKASFFVELENADTSNHKVWGIDLERALQAAGVKTGDHVALQNLGRQPVSIPKNTLDAAGNVVASERIDTYRNTWHAAVVAPGSADSPDPTPLHAPDTLHRQARKSPAAALANVDDKPTHQGEWFEVRAPGAATSYHATAQEAVTAAENRKVTQVFIVDSDFNESVLRKRSGTWTREPLPSSPVHSHGIVQRPASTLATASDPSAPEPSRVLSMPAARSENAPAPQKSPHRSRTNRPHG